MRHDDVVRKIMLAQLAHTLIEWLCNSITELFEEMELWEWDAAKKYFWTRSAKSYRVRKYQ